MKRSEILVAVLVVVLVGLMFVRLQGKVIFGEKEVCDNIDNDNNGLVDENLVQCCGNATCEGFQTCHNGKWSVCKTNEGVKCGNSTAENSTFENSTEENQTIITNETEENQTILINETENNTLINETIVTNNSEENNNEVPSNGTENQTAITNNSEENNNKIIPNETIRDDDHDGVPDNIDKCLGSIVPESVPTDELRPNNYAQIDSDLFFETNTGSAKKPVIEHSSITMKDTYGCTCEQILYCKPGVDNGEYKWGCSQGTMNVWVNQMGWSLDCQQNGKVLVKGDYTPLLEKIMQLF